MSDFEWFEAAARAVLQHRRDDLAGLRRAAMDVQAEWHPNGFAVFLLRDDSGLPGCVLRLHVWDPSFPSSQAWHPKVHSHDRHLASVVLVGTKVDIECEVSFATAGGSQAADGSVDVITPEQSGAAACRVEVIRPLPFKAVLVERRASTYRVGDFYSQRAGDFHEIPHPTDAGFATLCLKSPRISPDFQRLVGRNESRDRRVARQPVSAYEREALLSWLS